MDEGPEGSIRDLYEKRHEWRRLRECNVALDSAADGRSPMAAKRGQGQQTNGEGPEVAGVSEETLYDFPADRDAREACNLSSGENGDESESRAPQTGVNEDEGVAELCQPMPRLGFGEGHVNQKVNVAPSAWERVKPLKPFRKPAN